ncbi:MAG: YbhB/YbcL family Raf kinase inhibitor-like protein [Bacteroidetes bacterium]|nr:YbhB/YbcL family Raf kinase inhibitor-like protein [Bacteroidota bacterium]
MATLTKTEELTIGSTEFSNKGYIPTRYTCEGENINPSITIENIPSGTKSLALIVDDPDATDGIFDHWLIWNIRPMEMIIENTVPGTEGKNSFGKTRYHGPCPGEGRDHRYFFKVYALDILLDIKIGADKKTLEKAMHHHTLAKGEIIGMYKKTKHKSI